MSQDYSHYAREQLDQAIQEQAVLAQEKAIRASPMYLVAEAAQLDFIRSMRELEAMPCKPLTTEELSKMLNSLLSEDEEEIETDEYVIEAIIEREECELLDEIEGDKQAIDYFSEEHIDEFGDKGEEETRGNEREYIIVNTDIIQVLRKPRAPNVIYHKQCYTSQEHHKDDIVLEALRLCNDVKCAKCGIVIAKGDVSGSDVKAEKEVVVQMELFSVESVA